MNRIEQAQQEIQALQSKIDAGKALAKELDRRSIAAGFGSPEASALDAAIAGIHAEGQRLIALIAEISNAAFGSVSHGGDI